MKRVIVGLSGGVDSAVTAYLLKLAGYDVIGITLRTWLSADGKESRCCEVQDAAAAARHLDIPYYAVNCQSDFRRLVTEPFINEYLSGRTPNPCVGCNKSMKWDKLIEAADRMNADFIATGHYAGIVRLPNGRYSVTQAEHIEKDQTYMLYQLSQEHLARTLMPLGSLSKSSVRELAQKAGLSVADKPDSQEICFVPDGDYAGYIEDNAEREFPTEGDFTDKDGNVLGRHGGIYRYTIGQRKGLGLSLGHPVYVNRLDADSNRVIVGEESELYSQTVFCKDVHFMGIENLAQGELIKADVKVRYAHQPQPAQAQMLSDGELKITFEKPVRAAAPGQSAVLYDKDRCILCGGIITHTSNIT
ncbi:MAG: tRNA 2-thiouridine(34) synthase MnmA [Ruminococcus sp.]|nr:tRNA 2-thiouridine(34) synthase MnmA [Ruminococcus sp.]